MGKDWKGGAVSGESKSTTVQQQSTYKLLEREQNTGDCARLQLACYVGDIWAIVLNVGFEDVRKEKGMNKKKNLSECLFIFLWN